MIGYRDERVCSHLFSSTLDDLPNKWYKIEEARGYTFTWKNLKENFIKDFSFNTKKYHLREPTKHNKWFFHNPSTKQVDHELINQKSTTFSNQVIVDQNRRLASWLELENDNLPRKCFQWKTNHPLVEYKVKTTMKNSAKKKELSHQEEGEGKRDFPTSYLEVKE